MSSREAALACRLLNPKQVIPMHLGTFPPLTGRPEQLAELILDRASTEVLALEPGKSCNVVTPSRLSGNQESHFAIQVAQASWACHWSFYILVKAATVDHCNLCGGTEDDRFVHLVFTG